MALMTRHMLSLLEMIAFWERGGGGWGGGGLSERLFVFSWGKRNTP